MAFPTAYTDTTLGQYMLNILGAVGDDLGWTTTDSSVAEAINETLFAYETDDVTTITGLANLRKLRTLARREIWSAALAEVTGDYDVETPTSKMKRSQVEAAIRKNLAQANMDALPYDPNYTITLREVTYVDPYEAAELEE